MKAYLIGIVLVVLSDVFCAGLPVQSNLEEEGSRLDSARADHDRARAAAYKINTQIRKERKLEHMKEYLKKRNLYDSVMKDISLRNNEGAQESQRDLRSSHNLKDTLRASLLQLNEERQKREAIVGDKPIVRRSYSKSGRVRVRITDLNGNKRSYRKRRSQ